MIKIELNNKEYTFDTQFELDIFLKDQNLTINENKEIVQTTDIGCIPGILSLWFETRVKYKNLMKKFGKAGDTEQYNFYNKRQHVQKILLNSLYGCLGLPAFRFYDEQNAIAVTTTGQTVIKSTSYMANMKYHKELGGDMITIILEDDTKIIKYPNSLISIKRNGISQEILAKELQENDDIII